MPVPAPFDGISYNVPLTGELNWGGLGGAGTAVNDLLIALASKAALKTTQKQTVRTATSSPDSVQTTDAIVIYKLTVPGTVASTLPTGVANQIFYIVDGTGDAATNNITIGTTGGQTINGVSTYVIKKNRESVVFVFDGTEYKAISSHVGLGASNTVLTDNGWSLIANANVSGSAAIAYSKLALTNSILNADINTAAAIAYSKLNLTGSILNADINGSAAIAYSKLNLSGSIVNADINGSAAIAYTKLNLANSIVNADIASGAAISGLKISPSFGTQNVAFTGYEELGQIATPSAPSAGFNRLYAKSDGKLYYQSPSSGELQIADSGGGVDTTSNQTIDGQKTFVKGFITNEAITSGFTLASGVVDLYPIMNISSGQTVTVNGSFFARIVKGSGSVAGSGSIYVL